MWNLTRFDSILKQKNFGWNLRSGQGVEIRLKPKKKMIQLYFFKGRFTT
jgi:hypothetical protein